MNQYSFRATDDIDLDLGGPSTPTPQPRRSVSLENIHQPYSPSSVAVTPLTLDELLEHPYLTALTAQDTTFSRAPSSDPGAAPTEAQSSPSVKPMADPFDISNFEPAAASPSPRSPPHPVRPSSRGPSRMWIQVSNLVPTTASAGVLEQIGHHFRVHPVTVADLQAGESREKLEVFQHYLFLVVHSVVHPTPTIFDIVQEEEEEIREAKAAKVGQDAKGKKGGVPKQRKKTAAAEVSKSADDGSIAVEFPEDENPFDYDSSARQLSQFGRGGYSQLNKSNRNSIFRAAGLRTVPIQLIVFPNLVLSFHHGAAQNEINGICRRLDHLDETRMNTGQWIVHAMLDVVSSSLRPVVDEVEHEVDLLEELIYSLGGAEYADLLKRMGLTRRRLVNLKQQLKSKLSILNSLIGRDWQSVVSSVQTPYLRDVFDHVETMLVKVDCASEVLAALQDTYLANVQLRSDMQATEMNVVSRERERERDKQNGNAIKSDSPPIASSLIPSSSPLRLDVLCLCLCVCVSS